MKLSEDRQHDILLLITSVLFLIFASGLAVQEAAPGTVVIPPPA